MAGDTSVVLSAIGHEASMRRFPWRADRCFNPGTLPLDSAGGRDSLCPTSKTWLRYCSSLAHFQRCGSDRAPDETSKYKTSSRTVYTQTSSQRHGTRRASPKPPTWHSRAALCNAAWKPHVGLGIPDAKNGRYGRGEEAFGVARDLGPLWGRSSITADPMSVSTRIFLCASVGQPLRVSGSDSYALLFFFY